MSERFTPSLDAAHLTRARDGNPDYPYSQKAPWKDVLVTSTEMEKPDFEVEVETAGHGTLGEFLDIMVEQCDWDRALATEMAATVMGGGDHLEGGGSSDTFRIRRVASLEPCENPSPGLR